MPKTIPANPVSAVPTPVSLPTDKYKKLVVVSLLGTALIVSLHRSFKGSFPRPRVFVALVFIWVILGFLAEFSPKLAAYFAGLVFVAVLLEQGPYVFREINRRINEAPKPAAKPTAKPKGGKKK